MGPLLSFNNILTETRPKVLILSLAEKTFGLLLAVVTD
jgi:hypothetical protein